MKTLTHWNREQICAAACLALILLSGGKWVCEAGEVSNLAQAEAKQFFDATGIRGGVIVLIGCGDGRLAAALGADDNGLVHCLDADANNVKLARRNIQALGLYGKVSVEQWTGKTLPYVDNLVNLVVSEDPRAIPMAEILRVLVPEGVAYLKTGSKWTVKTKPRPKAIDEWTHFLHDASGNAVAHDQEVGPPRSLQWMAPPLWLRSHETPSGFEGMVSGGGRVLYFLDEGIIGITDQRLPERWALVCRDAFNGKLLWRKTVEPWGWPQWGVQKFAGQDWTTITGGRTVVPDENQRRLVVDGDRVYATLGYRAPLSILDSATGKVLFTVGDTAPARQILAADSLALVYSQPFGAKVVAGKKKRPARSAGPGGSLIAVTGATGTVLWRKDIGPLRGLALVIDQGRVIYQVGNTLSAANLQTGKELWQIEPKDANGRTLVAEEGVLVIRGGRTLEAYDAATGDPLWSRDDITSGRLWGDDLFIVNGVVWPGAATVDSNQQPGGRNAASVLAVGYDLRTGRERKRVFAQDIISPEHHHRCYRNKATDRYMITSMEGAEFIDLEGADHSQNNFVRGACRLGVMPCNGMLYVPPDQCFCQPGAKQLGLTAIASAGADSLQPVPDNQRLERGQAFGKPISTEDASPADWPTFRHDAARHGVSATAVGATVTENWRVRLGGRLTAPVSVGNRVYVASSDAHSIHVLDLQSGRLVWDFVAGGRIDSPPTIHEGKVLFGSADGRVYCLRAADGALVWRFLAAPCDRRIGCFEQLESAWPVHGSVLVKDGVAYVTAGRSTYLDGGIRLYALDPATGRVLHQNTLSGPFPDSGKTVPRDVSFYINGANSDVLVSEGRDIYMRQKRLTPSLQEVKAEVLSSKGETDVGLHVFSTSGLLDGSWYNRAFWMYSKRWPGFQLANQAPKSGQLLIVDDQTTYAVNPFVRRNVHSPMFFPAKEGYLLFADKNTTEPQIVGEAGARKPVAWLPQSDYERGGGRAIEKLGDPAFGLDKMTGYTRDEAPLWKLFLPVRVRAMVKAGDRLFLAGEPDELDEKDPYAALDGRRGARLVSVSAGDGTKLAERALDVPPVFDGMIAARGRLLVALEDGSLACLQGAN